MSESLQTINAKTATVSEQPVHKLRLCVPYQRRHIADASLALKQAQLLAGGWTTRHVAGGWIAPDGKSIIEPVDEHEFLVPYDKAQAVRRNLIVLSEELLAAGEQAVLLVVEHSACTITYTMS